jgi:rfaE bifunctional protein nucleotidyltransferase chain/domain
MKRDNPFFRKILDISNISDVLDSERASGKRVVLCHGAFDLLHVGHIRHLTAAAAFGDILVITLTADEYIRKGPDRPVFSSDLRLEFLAALSFVSYVAVVEAPSAMPAIDAVRPDFYVKGGEYENEKDDITGKIIEERERVESYGGKLVFTHEVTFSSSNLLNRHFGAINSEARDFIAGLEIESFKEEFKSALEKISEMRVLVIGETIVDHYVYVDTLGKAAKENIIATRKRSEEFFAGGALAAANHIASFCKEVELISMIGDESGEQNYQEFLEESAQPEVKLSFVHRPSGPTVRKTRFVEPTYVRKLFEVYDMDDTPMEADFENGLVEMVRERLPELDLIIVCDFGHGMLRPILTEMLQKEAPFLAVNAQSNAGNIGFNLITKYKNAKFVCIDLLEARLAAQDKHSHGSPLAARLRSQISGCDNFVVTSGRSGCYVSSAEHEDVFHVPVFSDNVVDTVGAGDAFFVVASLFSAAKASSKLVAFVGNVAGALKVKIVGHRRCINSLELQQYVATLLK